MRKVTFNHILDKFGDKEQAEIYSRLSKLTHPHFEHGLEEENILYEILVIFIETIIRALEKNKLGINFKGQQLSKNNWFIFEFMRLNTISYGFFDNTITSQYTILEDLEKIILEVEDEDKLLFSSLRRIKNYIVDINVDSLLGNQEAIITNFKLIVEELAVVSFIIVECNNNEFRKKLFKSHYKINSIIDYQERKMN